MGLYAGKMLDLLAARKARTYQSFVFLQGARFRQQTAFADQAGDVIVLISEHPCQPAAAAVQHGQFAIRYGGKKLLQRLHSHQRLLMAVSMN